MRMKITIYKVLQSIFYFYYNGFINMKIGKTLWILIMIKLFILFAIIKWLFFPNILKENFSNDKDRSEYILQHLTQER